LKDLKLKPYTNEIAFLNKMIAQTSTVLHRESGECVHQDNLSWPPRNS